MKLRNKQTGEIGNLVLNINQNRESYSVLSTENGDTICGNLVLADYDTLAELNEEWEDCEKPKQHWFIATDGRVLECNEDASWSGEKSIGNYFETKEEAEKAVEKLKAYKRLKDKGFRFEGIKQDYTRFFSQQKPMRTGRKYLQFNKAEDEEWMKENWEDLDLLFGGEE